MKRMSIKCNKCSYVAPNNSELKSHQIRIHSDRKPWACTFPGCVFRTKGRKDLNRHQRVHEKNPELRNPYPCIIDKCDYRAAQKWLLTHHIREKHNTVGKTRDFQCPLCPKKFYTQADLKGHISCHTKEKKFACVRCDFKTHQPGSLRLHIKWVHDNVKKFCCSFPDCGYISTYPGNFRRHERQAHKPDSLACRPFPCQFPACSYRASSSTDLKMHSQVRHSPDRRKEFACGLCSKEFYDKACLNSHIAKVHTYESKYSCDECSFTTYYRSSLGYHIRRVHVEGPGRERKFKCDSCDYSAHESSNLKRHQETAHSTEKKYNCSRCKFGSKYLNNFKLHQLIHEDDPDKQFPCTCRFPPCDFRRRSKREMREHERRHETSISSQHACELCPTRFYPDMISLEFHRFLSHGKTSYKCRLSRKLDAPKAGLAKREPSVAQKVPLVMLEKVSFKVI